MQESDSVHHTDAIACRGQTSCMCAVIETMIRRKGISRKVSEKLMWHESQILTWKDEESFVSSGNHCVLICTYIKLSTSAVRIMFLPLVLSYPLMGLTFGWLISE